MINLVGFINYSIDKQGRVWSHTSSQYMKSQKDKDGYRVVSLVGRGGKRKSLKVHRLLAQTFIPNPENKPCVNHIDGDKANNTLSNLEWCTVQENVQHAYDEGLQEGIKGERNANSKLTEIDVLFIRHWHNKFRLIDIAEAFNVSESLIQKVVYRKCWVHVGGTLND